MKEVRDFSFIPPPWTMILRQLYLWSEDILLFPKMSLQDTDILNPE
jgi:hypothetical protein